MAPTADAIRNWYQNFKSTGCICKGQSSGRPNVSGETFDRVLRSQRKSTRPALPRGECTTENRVANSAKTL